VSYVRENFFKGENWKNINELKDAAKKWCVETAGKRIHGTTRKRPMEVYEFEEKILMNPVEGEKYDPNQRVDLKVRMDQTVMFDKALYTVGTVFIGKRVTVVANSSLVRIYHNCVLIKTHKRAKQGEKQIDINDYPEYKRDYVHSNKEVFLEKARKYGGYIEKYIEALLTGTVVWHKLRQSTKLLKLIEKYGEERVQNACCKALEHEIISIIRLEKILEKATDQKNEKEEKVEYRGHSENLNFLRNMNTFVAESSELRTEKGGQTWKSQTV
jgi:hypothetical protein